MKKIIVLKSASVAVLGIFLLFITSCGKEAKKQQALQTISEKLLSDYECHINYSFQSSEKTIEGQAEVVRSGTVTNLKILSPEPYSGLGVEYNTQGAPTAITVHFLDIDTAVPQDALSKINTVASIFADDFAQSICKAPKENIREYDASNNSKGYCATVNYNGAEITLYFSESGIIPYFMEYVSESQTVDIVFESFNNKIIGNDK